MNTKGSSNTVGESRGTTISLELCYSPFDTDIGQDSISPSDFKLTSRSNKYIHVVLHSNKTVLSTTFSLCEKGRSLYSTIPFVSSHHNVVDIDFKGRSLRVLDSELNTCSSDIGRELELLIIGWSSCVFDNIISVSLDLSDEVKIAKCELNIPDTRLKEELWAKIVDENSNDSLINLKAIITGYWQPLL